MMMTRMIQIMMYMEMNTEPMMIKKTFEDILISNKEEEIINLNKTSFNNNSFNKKIHKNSN